MLLINEPPAISPVPADHPPPVSGGLLATEARRVALWVLFVTLMALTYRAGLPYVGAPVLCYNAQTYIWTGASHQDSGLSCAIQRSETIERRSHAEAELVALARERQNSRLWRNGEDGGRGLGYCRISACPAAAFRTDLKNDCWRVWAAVPSLRYHKSFAPPYRSKVF